MQCPKCQKEFEKIVFNNVEIDRCTGCHGLWFDALEKDDLLAMKGAESIDIGAEQVESRYRDMRDVQCPVCHQDMIPMVDKDQFHIKYESCPTCFGIFFDAGEFSDLKDHTVVERFKQMLDTLRTHL